MSAGDPTLLGWAAVLAYLVAAGLGGLAAWRAEVDRTLWTGLACGLVLMACNKQLDLQSVFTHAMREIARADGWYEHRRFAQSIFLVALAVTGTALLAWLLIRMRRAATGLRLAAVGLACLVVFVLGRAASFHHFDVMIGRRVGPVGLGIGLELIGCLLVAIGAIHASRNRPRPSR